MTSDGAFLRAINEGPDDDIRPVYADYLEENGHADRAAFNRVQCDLARLPESDPRREELEAKERALLNEDDRERVGPLLPWFDLDLTPSRHAFLALPLEETFAG